MIQNHFDNVRCDVREDLANGVFDFRVDDRSTGMTYGYSVDIFVLNLSTSRGKAELEEAARLLTRQVEHERTKAGRDKITGNLIRTYTVSDLDRIVSEDWAPATKTNKQDNTVVLEKRETEQRKKLIKYGRY